MRLRIADEELVPLLEDGDAVLSLFHYPQHCIAGHLDRVAQLRLVDPELEGGIGTAANDALVSVRRWFDRQSQVSFAKLRRRRDRASVHPLLDGRRFLG